MARNAAAGLRPRVIGTFSGQRLATSTGEIMSFEVLEKREIDIFTDVEPDDVLALTLLAKFFRFRAIFVVCSENPMWPLLELYQLAE